MSVITDLVSSSVGEIVKDIIGSIKTDPTVKAQLEAQVELSKDQILQKSMDLESQLNATAGQNIRAEETNGDKYTERARPTVIYGGLGMFFWNWCLAPLIMALFHKQLPTLEIPALFIETWGVVVTGYVFSRTVDKVSALPGDSQIKLPFGIQVGNSSPK